MARLIDPRGSVVVLPFQKVSWEQAQNGRDLFAGDSVKTGRDSRVSILCIDETQLKLNENTVVVLKSVRPSLRIGGVVPVTLEQTGASQYDVPAGEIWLRHKNENARFEVETPAVTVAIRGTEFNLRVTPDGATDLVLVDGKLSLANPQGHIDLNPGEEGFAEVGKAPVKRVILQPKDAVQWSLYYPGIFSFRDIPLAAQSGGKAESGIIRNAETAYDAGDLYRGERDADEELARNPENADALCILGWISLQRQDAQKAAGYFERAAKRGASPALRISGLALATYRLGDLVGAYKLMTAEVRKGESSSLTLVMSGYFAMLVGKIDEAKAFLADHRISGRDSAMAHSLLAQMYLIQNSKEQASREAAIALQANSRSPMAKMTAALVKISYFDLPGARRLLQESIAADPRFVEAYVYLARTWLGADYLDRAWKIIGEALEISKNDSEVLSLAGFIRLGYRDYSKAGELFEKAVRYNPAFGEPHIGLANIAFTHRNFALGLREMLTATLLEPRVSLYESSLGKALYQTRSFDKALEVYDYAKTLDPNDPTPYLYKGIALTDLYRPGEAIEEINKSIELNDNTAVFRSRLMLDRDLAVRNVNLATSYNQLGLSNWAFSKALTALKDDPLNPSAHLFLSSAYAATRENVGASGSELLQYFLLAPANENTFTQTPFGNYVDYTQMFEMPYSRILAQTGVGAWTDKNAASLNDSVGILGGTPGFAAELYGSYQYDPGYRKHNDDTESFFGLAQGKFEPTIKDSFYSAYTYSKYRWGDTGNPDDFSYVNDPNSRLTAENNSAEGGYVHRFSPEAAFIGYFDWGNYHRLATDYNIHQYSSQYQSLDIYSYFRRTIQNFDNVQLQQQLKMGDHTLIAGFDYFTGYLDYHYHEMGNFYFFFPPYWYGPYPYPKPIDNLYNPPDRSTSIYARDYWRLCSNLLVELGISGDFASSSRFDFARSISADTFNGLFGLDYQIDKSNTLRFAFQSYLDGHSLLNSSIAPSEVAGFPSQLNADDGSKVKELGIGWESQWNQKTFSVLRVVADRIDNPQYDVLSNIFDSRVDRVGGSYVVERILGSCLGLSAGVSGKIVSLDSPADTILVKGDFSEIDGGAALSYTRPDGWFCSITDTVVYQNLNGLSDKSLAPEQAALGNPFNLVNVVFGRYFEGKRGLATLSFTNVFNQHFYYQTEPVELWKFYPQRSVMATAAFFF
ncbi:MAG: FecR domain-containing protein [Syntrophobacteraceae bacterium]|nr:FecR domain-containing protein [Syntrophobacteraceae bacterium]